VYRKTKLMNAKMSNAYLHAPHLSLIDALPQAMHTMYNPTGNSAAKASPLTPSPPQRATATCQDEVLPRIFTAP